MLRKTCLVALVVLALPLASTQAGVRIGVGIGVPVYGGYYGGYYGGPYYRPYPYYPYYPYYRPYGAVYVAPAPVVRPARTGCGLLRTTRAGSDLLRTASAGSELLFTTWAGTDRYSQPGPPRTTRSHPARRVSRRRRCNRPSGKGRGHPQSGMTPSPVACHRTLPFAARIPKPTALPSNRTASGRLRPSPDCPSP